MLEFSVMAYWELRVVVKRRFYPALWEEGAWIREKYLYLAENRAVGAPECRARESVICHRKLLFTANFRYGKQ